MKRLLLKLVRWIRNFIKAKLHYQTGDLPYYITILIAAVLFIAGLNIFIELTDELAENELGKFDKVISDYVISFRKDSLTKYFTFMTHVGDRYGYITVSLVLALYFFLKQRSWKFIGQTVLVLMLSTLSNVIIKEVVGRERPALEHLVTVNTLSFPSGHSMAAMAFYGFLIYLSTQLKIGRIVRGLVVLLLVVAILSVGISRIYLGVHFPSDVAAGFAGGLIWVAFCIIIFNLIDLLRKRNMKKETAPAENIPAQQ
jgi:membrane-associated phospholipid phosphatase